MFFDIRIIQIQIFRTCLILPLLHFVIIIKTTIFLFYKILHSFFWIEWDINTVILVYSCIEINLRGTTPEELKHPHNKLFVLFYSCKMFYISKTSSQLFCGPVTEILNKSKLNFHICSGNHGFSCKSGVKRTPTTNLFPVFELITANPISSR